MHQSFVCLTLRMNLLVIILPEASVAAMICTVSPVSDISCIGLLDADTGDREIVTASKNKQVNS